MVALPFVTFAGSETAGVGEARGFGGPLTVEVRLAGAEIVDVEVLDHGETAGVSDLALEALPAAIVAQQSLAVDGVAGATLTSQAILSASAQALEGLGLDAGAYTEPLEQPEPVEGESEEYDVVIVGGGLAGLFAGLELERNHPDVRYLILEKLPVVGGSLPITGGAFFATDSKVHEEQGVVSTTEDVVDYFRASSVGAELNDELIRQVYALSGETLDWLYDDIAMPFQEELTASTSHSDRLYCAWVEGAGAEFVRTLSRYVFDEGIKVRLNARVQDLLVEEGQVVGVRVEEADRHYDVRAQAVLLTTGGFAVNRDLMQAYAPVYADGIIQALSGSTGDGFLFAEPFATRVVGDGTMGTYMTTGFGRPTVVPFMVTQGGERFVNELELAYRIQRLVADAADGVAFLIADSQNPNLDAIKTQVEEGIYTEYASLEELAEGLEIDLAGLLATVETYNAAVEAGENPGFGLVAEQALSLSEAPYYGSRVLVRTFATMPGLEVNALSQILDGGGEVIPGLYGAGELIAGNAFSYQYPGAGIGISWAATSGRYSAQQITDLLGTP